MIIKSLIYGAKIVLISKLEKKQIDDKDIKCISWYSIKNTARKFENEINNESWVST